ncbi:hypothetical protein SARC_04916 [Sphaeroforma arctica JP610]|uniref:GS catalytic domain-containing protein n=1 Tax=Sphaeroforma arctica JP610 TaxID=667725 RepID=A0A0L0G1V2_9EUKA|nr:hypothetical protein SARC_04916 [Sphaeroforma arctica JP610]KNC82811.1 hypothetical protein SARC_04916 [Sphaeroforma arctica JP610]|eukprot:XP_014156713.1 hypothetical protein SARC_04916 [Sphaeroforma arctica JP610]
MPRKNHENMGMITMEQLKDKVKAGEIATVVLGFTDTYGKLCGKRIEADFYIETPHTEVCNYLLACDIEMNPIQGFELFNWEKGFGDLSLAPLESTIRICSWHEKTALVLADVNDAHGVPCPVAPRTILKKQLELLEAKHPGYECYAASEIEYYTYRTSYRDARESSYTELKSTATYIGDYQLQQASREEDIQGKLRKHLVKSGVPIECSKAEAGIGQHELNVKYTEMLEMADRTIVYKQCLKEVAEQLGVSVTFMAKPSNDQSGSSCHVHVSMLKKDGTSAFYDTTRKWNGLHVSQEFQYFLGGLIKYIPECMPFIAPTINSYKRYAEGSWAPTRLAWCADNRTAGFRVVGEGQATRVEVRIPGADANVYLCFAAILACGLEGMRTRVECPDQFAGDVYAAKAIPEISKTLADAVRMFDNSAFARYGVCFG